MLPAFYINATSTPQQKNRSRVYSHGNRPVWPLSVPSPR